jgi:hypothetical protein
MCVPRTAVKLCLFMNDLEEVFSEVHIQNPA